MKRVWLGLGLLLGILAVGLLVTWAVEKTVEPVSRELAGAVAQAEQGDWAESAEAVTAAMENWEKHWHFLAAVSDHEPMEDIDGLFAQLQVYCALEEREKFSAAAARMEQMIEAMVEAHSLSWWNFM